MVKSEHWCYTIENIDESRFRERMEQTMARIEDLIAAIQKKEDEKPKNTVLWVFAIIGAITAVAGIAYAVYRYLTPDYLEDFDDDFEDDFDDYFEDDLEETSEEEDDEEKIFVNENEEKVTAAKEEV
jgi:hypothetical protein